MYSVLSKSRMSFVLLIWQSLLFCSEILVLVIAFFLKFPQNDRIKVISYMLFCLFSDQLAQGMLVVRCWKKWDGKRERDWDEREMVAVSQ